MKNRLYILLIALVATATLWAQNNVITYTATSKLTETTDSYSGGLHTNTFNVSITSHTFADGIGTITFAEDVLVIGYRTFYKCSGLTSITIPGSIITIGDDAFYNCISLTSAIIPKSVIAIGTCAFYGCESLNSITSEAVTPPSCGTNCFYRVMTSIPVYVPAGSVDAYKDANIWKNFTNIQAIPGTEPKNNIITYTATEKLTETTDTYSSGLHTDAFNVAITSHTFSNGTGTITFAGNLTTIGDYAFYKCSGLTSITIPSSVTSIGVSAFSNCTGLTAVTCEAMTPPTCGSSCFENVEKSIFLYVPANSIETYKAAKEWKNFINIQAIPSTESQNNVIIYTATGKLTETITEDHNGLHKNVFNVAITSHTFVDNTGVIIFAGDVTTIGYQAFYNCTDLTSVTIPNSVTSIGSYAFRGCSSLTSITIPDSVTSIGGSAFKNCYDLISITIPNSVTSIGSEAFYCCFDLTSVTIGNSVTTIGNYAFYDCGLTSIIIPNSVTTIGFRAFYGCSSLPVENNLRYADTYLVGSVDKTLSSYTIKEGTKWIGDEAFSDCSSLTTITIPNSVTSIGSYAFENCSTLTSITFPDFVTSIGSYAFENCSTLTSITFPDFVTSIGSYAFSSCSGLTLVTFGNSVTTIGYNAFYNCIGLTSISIPNSVTEIGEEAFSGCSGLTLITIGNSVTTIGKKAFSSCSDLTKTNYTGTIADWCKISFGSYDANPISKSYNLYINDVEIKDLVIPGSIITIGNYAFYNCGLTSVTIPYSVTSIGADAFCNCKSLTSITCEATTPPTYGSDCFYNVNKSVPLYVPKSNISTYQKANGWKSFTNIQAIPYNVITYTATNKLTETTSSSSPGLHTNAFNVAMISHTFANGVGTITFAEDVTTIGDEAFYGCKDLTSVKILNSITSIGNSAFYGCSGLTSEDIPTSVTTIGNKAFSNCTGLTSITIPNSVTTIGDEAFCGCKSLTSVSIPNSIITIKGVFSGCSGLTSIICQASTPPTCDNYCFESVSSSIPVYVPASSVEAYKKANVWKDFTNIKAQNNVIAYTATSKLTETTSSSSSGLHTDAFNVAITSHTFFYNKGIITFNGDVTTIGVRAFDGCDLTSVIIPNTVITIGSYAFRNCYHLTSVTIPNSVTTIGESPFGSAFAGCSGLGSITCYATTPPSCGSDCFKSVDTSIPLYVPKSSISAYEQAYIWKNFTNIKAIEDRTDFDINNTTTTIYELEALVTVPLDAKGEVTKYSYWLYLDNAHTDLVCSMDFDAAGKMSNPVIRKAPMREQAEEEQTFDSFTFEVSNLEANTTYYYVLKAFTNAKTFTKEGSFTTQSSAVRNAPQIKKVCKPNGICLEVDGNTYDIWGNIIQ